MELTLQFSDGLISERAKVATILVFMELTLQYIHQTMLNMNMIGHNPCFYGINFAIRGVASFILFFKAPQSLFLWN